MRPFLFAIALVTVVAIVGFEPSIGRTLRTTFPANHGSETGTLDISALPVILYDFTGLVTAVDVVEPPVYDEFHFGRIAQVDGDPSAIRVDWLAGACESRVTVLVFEAGDRYGLRVQSNGKLGNIGCPAIGIYRSLMIRFTQPMAPNQFTLKSPLDN